MYVYHCKIQYLTGAPILWVFQKEVLRKMPGQKNSWKENWITLSSSTAKYHMMVHKKGKSTVWDTTFSTQTLLRPLSSIGWVTGTWQVLKRNKLVPLPVRQDAGSSLPGLTDAAPVITGAVDCCTPHIRYFMRRRHSIACTFSWFPSVSLFSLGKPQV